MYVSDHLCVFELFVKDILTSNDPININEARLYFLEILAKLIFEEVVCEVLQWRSNVTVIFKRCKYCIRFVASGYS